MHPFYNHTSRRGFALILTLSLLSMLVLVVFAITSISKVDSSIGANAVYQTQARQNALLALKVGLGELQKAAGPDARLTGMAGVVGISEGDSLRQWTGVWGGSVSPQWLTSGAVQGGSPSLSVPTIALVSIGSVGSSSADQEWVEAGILAVEQSRISSGHYAYWVGDEGVKASAHIDRSGAQISSITGEQLRPDVKRLLAKTSFDPQAADLVDVISYEQLARTSTGKGIQLRNAFHGLTLTHRALPSTAPNGVAAPSGYVLGVINVNTTSAPLWRGILEYPDRSGDAWGLSTAAASNNGKQISALISNRAAPFSSTEDLRNSQVIHGAFATVPNKITNPSADQFIDDLRPILSTRSDTFRIRGYGDAINPADSSETNLTPEAVAYCEAIVQRTPEIIDSTAGPLGRRFVITYFRWLGPDDI